MFGQQDVFAQLLEVDGRLPADCMLRRNAGTAARSRDRRAPLAAAAELVTEACTADGANGHHQPSQAIDLHS